MSKKKSVKTSSAPVSTVLKETQKNRVKQAGIAREIKVLDDISISFDELISVYDGRYPNELANRFLAINAMALRFLGIEGVVSNPGSNGKIKLTSSRYAGCIPLINPNTGLHGGSITILGRYGEDISELYSVVESSMEPEFDDRLKFRTDSFVKPPLYFECMKYIDKYIEAQKYKWRKFDNVEKIQPLPTGSTRWDNYALKSYDPANTFKYPNKCNVLTRIHPEWLELTYVLDYCISEVMSTRTPSRSKLVYQSKINTLRTTYDKRSLKPVKEVRLHMSDPLIIKQLKESANKILNNVSSSNCAWRMDYAEFFERYVQYICKRVAQLKGAHCHANAKYNVSGPRPAWTLHYLEPDVVLEKGDKQIVIDAKYKSHMLNVNGSRDELKEIFREDFHQVLAYSSFSGSLKKNVMLFYPYNPPEGSKDKIIWRKLLVKSSMNNYACNAYLIGMSLKKADLEDVVKKLSSDIIDL